MGTSWIAIAAPPTGCVCSGPNGRTRSGCNTTGCSAGDDTNCNHGYTSIYGGYVSAACACPGYNTTATGGYGPYYTDYSSDDYFNTGSYGNTHLPPFTSCA
ncbi:unnamed protein product, partial [Rotaria socialis]